MPGALLRALRQRYEIRERVITASVQIDETVIIDSRLPAPVQTVRMRAALAGAALELLLVNPPERLRDNDSLLGIHAALAGSYPGVLLVFYKSYGEGHATIVHAGEASAHALAAAVAAWSYSGAWDESDPIVVTVNGRKLGCSVQYDDGRWHVAVRKIPA